MAWRQSLRRITRVLRAEDRRRAMLADRDGKVARTVMMMAFQTMGNRLEGGLVVGEGPYAGVTESEALAAFACRNHVKALDRIEAMKQEGGTIHAGKH